ncbi:YkgJ family cysteine cluster protein [Roseospira visakhapatnamensis]|uniref:Fe-S-cluster containining protein n=1 Tax=Roseospira visakhapatnamensis TaxID=390880 RepID=A0A7W6RFD1_9PROT|nr:YkgJ family cysteine cluster protein [Roseospira visakhapatnamensis]MBB4267031.1 Fe-S-cluster containining protein [Roseospira visakhapatnamensis]
MDRHFQCTLCGRCCYGMLPLTVEEALERAGRVPLALVWMPVPKGARTFETVRRLGLEVSLGRHRTVAVLVSPMAYLPPAMPCPDLTADNRCAVHEVKPVRCRAMPFDPRRREDDQSDSLTPRPDWICDVSAAAPLVYEDGHILNRMAFDAEKAALQAQAPLLRAYAESRLRLSPNVLQDLKRVDPRRGVTGTLALSFTTLLPRLPDVDPTAFADAQAPVLEANLARTRSTGPEGPFHRYYREVLETVRADRR